MADRTQTTDERSASATPDRSTGELVAALTEQVSTLARQELRLAQTELQEKAKGVGIGAGLFGGAGVLALYGLGALVITAIAALALVLEVWLAAAVVAVVLFAAAGVVALVGKKKVSEATPPTPERTVESVKRDIAAVRGDDR